MAASLGMLSCGGGSTGSQTTRPAELTGAQWRILRLMTMGMSDVALSSATGATVKTVRRHVTAVLLVLGARTRFAGGVEAARRGWLRAEHLAAGGADDGSLTPFDRRVLALLAAGHRDAYVATLTGTCVRTVRRRITAIVAHFGVTSRFAAGVEAYRRGLVPAALAHPGRASDGSPVRRSRSPAA
ncbi:hypothetical protein RB614_27390 [Phytohabitans sp. ZYX-F-186]|uniref:HTH luxR-type domain-containing protein n=1 Tax=Phytohabitans maris TaxID=3071409 RepID=A0ABU0ZNK8_9ACTN|nr:hypothetical protein [Phytohabitans sp. ZYX-F-186]MDQ7908256.1 hypothetical protein [Phytohabitans sp. ZYX-F-186]